MRIARAWWALISAVPLAGFACENPPLVVIPPADKLRDRAEEVHAAMERYFRGVEAYTACIKAELEAAGGENAPTIMKTMLVRRNNAAVAEAEAMLKLYNAATGADQQTVPVGALPEADSGGQRRRER